MSEFSPDDVDFSAISIGNARFAVWCATEDEANCLVKAAKMQYPGIGYEAFENCTYFKDGGTYYFLNLNNTDPDNFGSGPRLTYSWNTDYVVSHGYVIVPFSALLNSKEIEPSDDDISILIGGFNESLPENEKGSGIA